MAFYTKSQAVLQSKTAYTIYGANFEFALLKREKLHKIFLYQKTSAHLNQAARLQGGFLMLPQQA
jgi:hypothetical protein